MDADEITNRKIFDSSKDNLAKTLSYRCSWRGVRIAEVFCLALTDANLNTEMKKILPTLCKVFKVKSLKGIK